MGIRGLNTFIKKVCPECVTYNKITKYSGKVFAIDASILIYKYRYISKINDSSHIIGFINRVKYYLSNNIIPVFIFDGIPPIEKKNTLKKRQNIKNKIQEKIDILHNINKHNSDIEKEEINKEIDKLSNQIIYVTKYHIYECQKLLKLLGIPFMVAPDEAEKYCVFLQNEKLIDYIVTDDTDVLTFGGNKILKTSIKSDIIEVDLNVLLNKIEYNKDKFIELCVLSGCDYLPFIPNLAINTVYTLFKKHG